MDDKEKLQRITELLDQYATKEARLQAHMILADGHEDEYTANAKVADLHPVAYMGTRERPASFPDYLATLGINPQTALLLVSDAYDTARKKAEERGVAAPKPTANVWDCYWCLCSMIADHWATHNGDMDVAALLAYEHLTGNNRQSL